MNKKINEKIELKQLDKRIIKVKLHGTQPLLMEKMDMSVVINIENKKTNKTVEKDIRPEHEKVEGKIHRTSDGEIGFPAIAFHKAMVEVAPYIDGMDKKKIRGSIRVLGDIIPIKFDKQITREDWGKSSGITGAPRLIVRPGFTNWSCELEIVYNNANISAENIINLLNWAGFQIGVGSWRPEKSGTFGQFEVITDE